MAANFLDDLINEYTGVPAKKGVAAPKASNPLATKLQSQISRIDQGIAKRKQDLEGSTIQRTLSKVSDFINPFEEGDAVTNKLAEERKRLQAELDQINRTGAPKKNEGVVDDLASTFRSGVGVVKNSAAYLGKKVGVDTTALQESGEIDQEAAQQSYSEETKRIRQEGVFGDQEGIADRAYAAVLGATESAPGMLATIPLAAAAAYAIPEAALVTIGARAAPVIASRAPWLLRALGVSAEQAATRQGAVTLGRSIVGTLAGTAAEGVHAGGAAGYETEKRIADQIDANPDAFRNSELGRKLLEENGGDFEKARAQAVNDVAANVALTTGAATSLLAIPGSMFESRLINGLAQKGILKEAGIGAVSEGLLQEAPQSGAEQLISNVGMQSVGSDVGTFEGVGRAAAEGGVVGGLVGGGLGVVGGALTPSERQAPAPAAEDTELRAALEAQRGEARRPTPQLDSPDNLAAQEMGKLDQEMGTIRVKGLNLAPSQILQSAEQNRNDPRIENILSQPVSQQTKVEQVARIYNAEEATKAEQLVVPKVSPLVGGTTKVSETRMVIEDQLAGLGEEVIAESPVLSAMAQVVQKNESGQYVMGGKQAVTTLRNAVTGYRPTAPAGQTLTVRPERGGEGGVTMTPDQVADEAQRERQANQAFKLAERRQQRYENQTFTGGQREDLRPNAPEPTPQIFLNPEVYGEALGGITAEVVTSENPGMVRIQYESPTEVGQDGTPVVISEEVSPADLIGRVVRGSPRMTQDFAGDQRNPPRGVGTEMAGPRNSIDRTSSRSMTTTPQPGVPMAAPIEPNLRYEGAVPNQPVAAPAQDQLPSPQPKLNAPTEGNANAAQEGNQQQDNQQQRENADGRLQEGGQDRNVQAEEQKGGTEAGGGNRTEQGGQDQEVDRYSGRTSKRQKRTYGVAAPQQQEAVADEGAPQADAGQPRTTAARETTKETPDKWRAEPKDKPDYDAVIQDRLDKLAATGRQGSVIAKRLRSLLKDKNLNGRQLYYAFRMGEVFARVLPKNSGIDILFVPSLTADNASAAEASATRIGAQIPGKYQAYTISQNGFRGLITMSLSDDVLSVARENAAHEAFHVIQDMLKVYDPQAYAALDVGFFDGMTLDDLDPSIKRTLQKLSLNGETSAFDSLKADFGNTPFGSRYEAQAVAFGALVDAKDRGAKMKGLKASFARVVDFLYELNNSMRRLLRQDGIMSVADFYEGFRTGKYQEYLGDLKAPLADELGMVEEMDERYSARTGKPPENTVKAYKLFRVDPRKPGKLFPLFVRANEDVPVGEWLDADVGEMVGDKVKSKLGPLAFRPGWHGGDLPIATHIGEKSDNTLKAPDTRPNNQVWAEVEFAADRDWQEEANRRARRNKNGDIIANTAQITDQVPTDGHYRYKTNPNMTGHWLISGSMKVNRVLTDQEVQQINDAAGVADLPRKAPLDTAALGFGDERYSGRTGEGNKNVNARSLATLQRRIPLASRVSAPWNPGQEFLTVNGKKFTSLNLDKPGAGVKFTQEELNKIWEAAIIATDTDDNGELGNLTRTLVEQLGMNPNTPEFWDAALKLQDRARYWYEVSAEAFRDLLPDLTDAELKTFIAIVAATSPVANPYQNMHRAVASMSNYLRGVPIDNDVVIPTTVREAIETGGLLEGLKTGSFGGTMQFVLGLNDTPPLSTNDRQVASTFNTSGDQIAQNPILYEFLSRFYEGIRDAINAKLPAGAQPYETWQLQALGWVEERNRQSDANDFDDYLMAITRRSNGNDRTRMGVLEILEKNGVDVKGGKLTREVLLDPRVSDALSPTSPVIRSRRVITAEINTVRTPLGQEARSLYEKAVAVGDNKAMKEYEALYASLLFNASRDKTNPFKVYLEALAGKKVGLTRVSTPTKMRPLDVGGSYNGVVSPNIRVPVDDVISEADMDFLLTSLSKQWDQDAVAAGQFLNAEIGQVREGYTRSYQVFVQTTEPLTRDAMKEFLATLPAGVNVGYDSFPNGFGINLFPFDADFNLATPDQDAVASAARSLSKLGKVTVKQVDFKSGGYGEIQNYANRKKAWENRLVDSLANKLYGKISFQKGVNNGRQLTKAEIRSVIGGAGEETLRGVSTADRSRLESNRRRVEQRRGLLAEAERIARGLITDPKDGRNAKLKRFVANNKARIEKKAAAAPKPVAADRYSGRSGQRYTGGVSQSMMDKIVSNYQESSGLGDFLDKTLLARRPGESRRRAFVRNSINDMDGGFYLDKMLDAKLRGVDISDGRIPVDGSSVGRAMEMASQAGGVVEMALVAGPPVYDNDATNAHEDIPGLLEIFKPIGSKKQEAFQTYAVARRESDLRRNGRIGFPELTDAEIAETLANADAEFAEVFENYQEYNRAVIDYGIDTGLLTAELGEKLKAMDYVPYYRAIEDELGEMDTLGPKMQQAINNPKSGLDLKLKGSDANLGGLYENLIKNTRSIIMAAKRNLALQETADAVDALVALGVDDIGRRVPQPEGENIMRLRVDGKPVYYKIDDLAVWTALAGMRPIQRGVVTQIMSRFANVVRGSITLLPPFMLASAVRAKTSTYVTTDINLSGPIATIQGMADAMRNGDMTAMIKYNTGFGGYSYGQSEADYVDVLLRRYRMMDGDYTKNIQRFTDRFGAAFEALERLGEASEFAERNVFAKNLVDAGMPQKTAAYEAVNVTNYGRKGAGEGLIGGLISALIPVVPFLNARIQGLYRMAENQQNQKTLMGLRKKMLLRGLLYTAGSLAIYAISSQDDRWDEEKDEVKMLNDILYIGDYRIQIPRPFEVGTFFGAAPVAFLDYMRNKDGDELWRKGKFLTMNTLGLNPIPQAFKGALGAYFNYDSFTQRPIENMADQNLPSNMRYDIYTSGLARGLGDTFVAEFAGLSPKKIDYLIQQYLGPMGTLMTSGIDTALAGVGVIPDKPGRLIADDTGLGDIAASVSGLDRFVKETGTGSNRFVNQFYELKREADQLARARKVLIEQGRLQEADRLLEKNRAPINARTQLGRIARQMGDVNKKMDKIEMDRNLTPSQKKLKLKPLVAEKNRLARQGYDYARGLKIAPMYDDEEGDTEE